MSFVVNASAEELAKLFHHYQEALAGDFATAPSCRALSWEKTSQKERDLKIAAVRMALLQLAETRGEYLSDRGGFISGRTQALKESTLTYEYKFADGFLARAEWRRDFSNQPFFLTETPDVLKKEQNTATLGLMWWWGRKQGSW